jgi:serine/threonine protein kinase/Tol biopolymer transport system component
MPLSPGTRVGAYEIVAPLGAGGMGEVYRARDTRLGRDVAIKTLPSAFAADPQRTARLEREAQLLAALDNPHIAGIYGIEDVEGGRVLVLEFVDGESLSERLAKSGRLPVDEALTIARQIIDALEAAHEKGIIHRDLKPANIMLAADGRVKVLDFGLAKLEPGSASPSGEREGLTHSPTLTFAATQAGVILGTAAYMSPEQAKGRAADKRSDVWAFGCVLYEMLTGNRAFAGEDVSDTLAAILRGEPDWNAFPPDVPEHVRAIVRQSVAKDRKARIPDIAVARFMLDHAPALPAAAVDSTVGFDPRRRRTTVWQLATAFFAVTTVAGFGAWLVARPTLPAVARFVVVPPENSRFSTANRLSAGAAISPDGSRLALTVRDAAGKVQLWVRTIDSLIAQPLAGTDGAEFPFWSPDSRFIVYSTPGKLMKVAATGGPPQTLCALSAPMTIARGGAWTPNGDVIFNNGQGPLARVSSGGGQPSTAFPLAAGLTAYSFPSLLPDGRHVLAYGQSRSVGQSGSDDVEGVYALSLDTGEAKRLLPADTGAVFAQQGGYLLFVRQDILLAQAFDPKTLSLSREPFVVAERVEAYAVPGLVSFSVSANGVLAYGVSTSGGDGTQLNWIDRAGRLLQPVGPLANYRGIDLSPDGTRVAAHRHERAMQGDVWVTELARGTTSRITSDPQENSSPIWSPDGRFIAFASLRGGKWGLYRKASDNTGGEERLLESDGIVSPQSWSPDGQSIVYTAPPGDLWLLPLSGDRKPMVLVNSRFAETWGQVSPDGRWLAYASNETGAFEVYVRPFPAGGGKVQVSTRGGQNPRWRRDGRELFYMALLAGEKLMAVDVTTAHGTFEAGPPKELFDSGLVTTIGHSGPYHSYAVSPDGQRFLIPQPPSGSTPGTSAPVVVVINWAAALQK